MSKMLREILVTPDPDTALKMASEDDAVDDINHYLLSYLTQREWKASVREAVETAQMTRYYERFADHCVAVAGRIIYLSTGLAPEEYMAKLSEEERDKEFRIPHGRIGASVPPLKAITRLDLFKPQMERISRVSAFAHKLSTQV